MDWLICTSAAVGTAGVGVLGWWVPGWWKSALTFVGVAAALVALRWLAQRGPRLRACGVMADFWLLPAAVLFHQALGPLVDAVHPALADPALAQLDLRFFGTLPAAWLCSRVGPLVTELLLLCYYSYFLWPAALGVSLYLGGQRTAFQEYTLALGLAFVATFVGYLCVPAVGPRFFAAGIFPRPLQGLWLTPWLDSAMRSPLFMRDCFPSGHTAVTLVVLAFARRHLRSFFWGALLPCVGLVSATLVGRFHYAVDLLVALPVAFGAVAAAGFLLRGVPLGAAGWRTVWPQWGRPRGEPV